MTNFNDTKIALETWNLCSKQLPRDCGWTVAPHPKDPSPLNKKGNAPFVTRLRILPKPKYPSRFWSSSWCFYEILIGPIDGALNLGSVHFLQFSEQAVCGKGTWRQPVMVILRELHALRPQDLSLAEFNDRNAVKPQLSARYRINPQLKTFPVALAAADLAWLINQSLPRFHALRLATNSSEQTAVFKPTQI